MNYSVAVTTEVQRQAQSHLLRTDHQEDLCFALWSPSEARSRHTALIRELVLPQQGDRMVHGNASFAPQYFERAVGLAAQSGAGLAFMHSHLGPGWQGMSPDDVAAEQSHAASSKGATGLPLVGMTLGTDGTWSARFWEKVAPRKYERCWCESIRVVGDKFGITFNDSLLPAPHSEPRLVRTVSAWGEEVQSNISRLKIGIAGAGSVGSIVAEILARTGFSKILLLDFDAVETINLDRLLHATRRDVGSSKVSVLARALRRSATASSFAIEPSELSVTEEAGFRAALDCDILFSCVDRPWPRHVLNFIAYAHLIPVVDGGVLVKVNKSGKMKHADVRAHVAVPARRCLQCLKQYDPGDVSTEREGYLDNPEYIKSLAPDHPLKKKENVFAFANIAASMEVSQLLSMLVAPSGIGNTGAQLYHFVTGEIDVEREWECKQNCFFREIIAKGDRTGIEVTAKHIAAELARKRRSLFSSKATRLGRRIGLWK
jgi:hypothetical protein